MIFLDVRTFINENNGKREILVNRAWNDDGKPVILPCEHPSKLGAMIYEGEWVIFEGQEYQEIFGPEHDDKMKPLNISGAKEYDR